MVVRLSLFYFIIQLLVFLGYAKDTIQVTSKRCEEKIKNKTAMIEMTMYKVVLEKKNALP